MIRPWLASIVEPTRSPAPNTKRPEVEVELAWVHGYSSQMTRNSLAYNLNREAIYPVRAQPTLPSADGPRDCYRISTVETGGLLLTLLLRACS